MGFLKTIYGQSIKFDVATLFNCSTEFHLTFELTKNTCVLCRCVYITKKFWLKFSFGYVSPFEYE